MPGFKQRVDFGLGALSIVLLALLGLGVVSLIIVAVARLISHG